MTTTTTTTAVPLLDLKAQYDEIGPELERAVLRVMRSGQFVLGPEGKALEAEAAAYLGVKHAVGCASGSDALLLALRALDVGPDQAVVTTPFTFFATAGAPARAGIRVDFVDVEPGTLNLDPAALEAFLGRCRRDARGDLREPREGRRVTAIIAVDLFGRPCRYAELGDLARRFGLKVIDDAAQAFGAALDGRKLGAHADVTTYSFYPTKNLGGAGDGGLLATQDDALAARLRGLRVHGEVKRYVHREVGWNSRLDELQAAVVRVKLQALERWNAARIEHARAYDAALGRLDGVRPLDAPAPGCQAIYHLYVVRARRRDALRDALTQAGIGTGIYYPLPLHLQECFAYLGYRRGDLPQAEAAADEVLALPMYAELPAAARERVCEALARFHGA